MTHSVFVTGATGAQGGYVARELINAGHTVHATARDPSSPAAEALVKAGVKLFPGDFDSVASMAAAAQGCDAAFINVSPVFTDPDGETKHGQNVVEALNQAGVVHVVQSSVAQLERHLKSQEPGADGFMSSYLRNKVGVERTVKEGNFERWAILRVPRLLNSYVAPLSHFMFPELQTEHVLRTALSPDFKQSVIDPLDVGKATTLILEEKSDKYKNRTFEFAETQLTMREIVDAMNAALGGDRIRLEHRDTKEAEELQKTDLRIAAELHLNEHSDSVQVDNPEQFGLTLHTAKQYFVREKVLVEKALSPS